MSLRQLYQRIVPRTFRRMPGVADLARRLSSRFASHDMLYTAEYFDADVERAAEQAAPAFARLISEDFQTTRIIDVGCGTGALLQALVAPDRRIVGLEYAAAALARCRARGLDVRRFDLERDTWQADDGTFDLAISMEVAEHLPASAAHRYVGLLATLAPSIVFTAATLGQGGLDHVNEQPHTYWIAMFGDRGYQYLAVESDRWRQDLAGGGCAAFYHQNLMLFRRDAPRPG